MTSHERVGATMTPVPPAQPVGRAKTMEAAPRAMTLANRLTILRIVLAATIFLALAHGRLNGHRAALVLFLGAILTDWFDGLIARRTKTVSSFGKVADPIADKILVVGVLIALSRIGLGVPLWGIFLIVARELLIGGMRILTSAQGKVPIAAEWGKWKMGVQSFSILAMLGVLVARESLPEVPAWVSRLPYILTVVCVIAAWNSAYLYFRQSRKILERSWS